MCWSSVKDFRNAVVAARGAQGGWSHKTAYNRCQILYRIAEVLEGRKAQFVEELELQGISKAKAQQEVDLSIDRLIYYAGWCDKYTQLFSTVNPVALIIAALALAGTGASDEVSAIFRSTMMLVAAPDNIRGRIQGIFTVVVFGGPRIGDLYMGILATAVALWFPPLLGGLVIIAAVGVIGRIRGGLRNYDALAPTP